MNRLLFSSIILVYLLSNCSNNSFKDYDSISPYIEVEKINGDYHFKDDGISVYINLMEEKKTFICLLYSSSCSYCEKEIENIIVPYVNETSNYIYGLDVYKNENYNLLNEIGVYQPSSNNYFHLDDQISISRPTLQIVENGTIIAYEVGYSYRVRKMLDAYIIK